MTPDEKKVKVQFPDAQPEYGKDLVRLLAGDTLLMVTVRKRGESDREALARCYESAAYRYNEEPKKRRTK